MKLEALAAKQVVKEFKIAGVWSWGWATFNANATPDPDKPAAACVWLWARDPTLCDGPAAAGEGFNASLADGQVELPAAARCVLPEGTIDRRAVSRLTALTGDSGYATSVLFEQLVLNAEQPVDPKDLALGRARRAGLRLRGSRTRYWARCARRKLTIADARAIIRRAAPARPHPGALPPARRDAGADRGLPRHVREPAGAARARDARRRPGSAAPRRAGPSRRSRRPSVFTLEAQGEIDTTDGSFTVTPLGPVVPLGLVPRAQARAAAKAALERLARDKIYRSWLHAQEASGSRRRSASTTACRRRSRPISRRSCRSCCRAEPRSRAGAVD